VDSLSNGLSFERKCRNILRRRINVLTLLLLLGILYAGLKPFHAPVNGARWSPDSNGIRLGDNGTIVSSDVYSPSGSGRAIEIWIEPRTIEETGTIIAFYNSAATRFFSLSQELGDLELSLQSTAAWRHETKSRLHIADQFRPGKSVFLAVSSGPFGTDVYRDGRLAKSVPGLRILNNEAGGRLVAGTSPIFDNDWSGILRGIAVYNRALTSAQAVRHYETWTRHSTPAIKADEACIALYLFDERTGQTVHNRRGPAGDLFIPARYLILHPTILDPVWRAFRWSKGFWSDAIVNLAGFIPVGFFLCAWFSSRGFSRSALMASLFGSAISLFIELVQTQLPTRDSSMSDLITNVTGSVTGAILCTARAGFTSPSSSSPNAPR
jgi:hypothetical protein